MEWKAWKTENAMEEMEVKMEWHRLEYNGIPFSIPIEWNGRHGKCNGGNGRENGMA